MVGMWAAFHSGKLLIVFLFDDLWNHSRCCLVAGPSEQRWRLILTGDAQNFPRKLKKYSVVEHGLGQCSVSDRSKKSAKAVTKCRGSHREPGTLILSRSQEGGRKRFCLFKVYTEFGSKIHSLNLVSFLVSGITLQNVSTWQPEKHPRYPLGEFGWGRRGSIRLSGGEQMWQAFSSA